MRRIQLNTTIIYRVPQFSYQSDLAACWEELKQSIKESASESFYKEIADLRVDDLPLMPPPIKHTIWKYFNRACYRATPYGSFAGVGLATIKSNPEQMPTITAQQSLSHFPDWTCHTAYASTFNQLVKTDARLYVNSTWYQAGEFIRYVAKCNEGYELSEVPYQSNMLRLLNYCIRPQPVSALVSLFNSDDLLLKLLEDMVADQLLIPEFSPNIIGPDYFSRIATSHTTDKHYVIAERPLKDGCFDRDIFKHVPQLITRLHQLLPSYNAPELESFAARFSEKFGEAEVPVMIALDPELGVGYSNMEQDTDTSELIEKLSTKSKVQAAEHSTVSLLLRELINRETGTLQLEKLPIPDAMNHPLPNTIPVLLSSAGSLLILEHAGGATANALLGRFTLASDEIHTYCRNLASLEQQANPDVLFFDIGYLTGKQVDNVNRRKAIYDHQLNILAFDTSDEPLLLTDLLVSVRGGQVYLRSRSMDKRMVPRLATAYNYLLSDLPVFRFLCDLQHQGIHKNLSLRLRDRFPGQHFYPRVQYANIIVSPAAWQLRWQNIATRSQTSLMNHLQEKGVPMWVRMGQGDRMLTLNTSQTDDLDTLLIILKKEQTVYLEEMPANPTGMLRDETNNPYFSQYMLTLHHAEQIYTGINKAGLYQAWEREPLILPGSDWLYFEIFCHPVRVEELLTGPVETVLRQHQERIKKWFFVRYHKSGPHLRLRFQLNDPADSHQITVHLMSVLQPYVDACIISEIAIKPYQREINRYGVEHIELIEQYFCLESCYVMGLIHQRTDDDFKYISCLAFMETIKNTGIIPDPILRHMVERNSKGYNKEHDLGPEEFKLLNAYSHTLFSSITGQADHQINDMALVCSRLLHKYEPIQRPKILSALLHMHINRLFASSQRMHETAIYYFAHRFAIRQIHEGVNAS